MMDELIEAVHCTVVAQEGDGHDPEKYDAAAALLVAKYYQACEIEPLDLLPPRANQATLDATYHLYEYTKSLALPMNTKIRALCTEHNVPLKYVGLIPCLDGEWRVSTVQAWCPAGFSGCKTKWELRTSTYDLV